jgi:type VI secretion system secreted protein Hcp
LISRLLSACWDGHVCTQKEDEMAVNMFLNIDGIPGESQDKAYHDMIEVQGWSWGVSQSTQNTPGSGSTTGRPNIQNFSVSKWVDKATPKIYENTLQGRRIKECRLTCCRKDGGKYLEIAMSDCILASVLTGGKTDEDRLTETLAINFGRVDISYFLKDASGKPLTVRCAWDSKKNVPI